MARSIETDQTSYSSGVCQKMEAVLLSSLIVSHPCRRFWKKCHVLDLVFCTAQGYGDLELEEIDIILLDRSLGR